MIINGVLFFLRIFDFACDSIDKVKSISVKPVRQANIAKKVSASTKPSYS